MLLKTNYQGKKLIKMAIRGQCFSNSCGAASLLCAAIELDVKQIPARPALQNLWNVESTITLPNGDYESERKIYAVTSGIARTAVPDIDTGYSLPSNIARAVKALGLDATAYVPYNLSGILLRFLYGDEIVNSINAGMPVIYAYAPPLIENQRLLKVFRVGDAAFWKPATGLHYVMQRPNNSLMDPAAFYDDKGHPGGDDFISVDNCIQHHRTQNRYYQDTGISILISKKH